MVQANIPDGSSDFFNSALDFGISIMQEKILGKGEDSFLLKLGRTQGVAGVFDGCGGSGAKKYGKFQGHSGAFMASRVVGGAVQDWFYDCTQSGKKFTETSALKNRIKAYLSLCQQVGGEKSPGIRGSLSKEFPTTMAVITSEFLNDHLQASCLWAGDSRCYLWDSNGLKQLTMDDLGGLDAMENLTADGVLTNVISNSNDFTIHVNVIRPNLPCLLFAATDGCFGYLSTPMEFEAILLSTLLSAKNISGWEDALTAQLREIAGDDFTLTGMAFGFGDFLSIKSTFLTRYKSLYRNYIAGINDCSQAKKIALWEKYKIEYSKFLQEE